MVTRPPRVTPQPPPEVKKLKICLLGDCQVGKTAFAKVFAEQEYPDQYEATVGSDFFVRNMTTMNGIFQFNLWDLSGDPVYAEVRNEFFKESQALILMYDVCKPRTFQNMENWLKEAKQSGGETLPIYVVGTKTDLDDRRSVQKAEAERWTQAKNAAGYFETSAKENNGFLRIFREIADQHS